MASIIDMSRVPFIHETFKKLHFQAKIKRRRRRASLCEVRVRRLLVNWALPLFREQEIRKIADPMLSIEDHYYMEEAVGRALELAYMCFREDANATPTVKEVVVALDNIVKFIVRKKRKESVGYGRGVELEKRGSVAVSSPKETTRMLSVDETEVEVEEEEDLERERAVADAKNWAETMRALRRQSNETPKP